ncbi:MAG TPA: DinB family protein [Trueperaceae bacterium]|nr:DinB family protein [Trueperaceae bacterium]
MAQDLRTFYDLVRRTRAGVLDWLGTLPPEVLNAQRADFAFGSLSRIFSHVAECYLLWLSRGGVGEPVRGLHEEDADGLRAAFARVDAAVEEALSTWTDWDEPFVYTFSDGWQETLSRRWLVLHPITHEFHHKGQALALARVLGHPHPGNPDTDLAPPGWL